MREINLVTEGEILTKRKEQLIEQTVRECTVNLKKFEVGEEHINISVDLTLKGQTYELEFSLPKTFHQFEKWLWYCIRKWITYRLEEQYLRMKYRGELRYEG
jgi:hypothetical protein